MRAFAGMVVAGALLASCSSKPLQDLGPDGSGGGIAIDAGRGRDPPDVAGNDRPSPPDAFGNDTPLPDAFGNDTPLPDAAPDLPSDRGLPFTGQRSYLVTSLLQRDGGVGLSPASHTFTMVLDADRRTAITGGAGEGNLSSFEQTAAGELHIVGSLRFAPPGNCPGSSIMYGDLTFTIDTSDRLTGAGRGQAYIVSGDVAFITVATMSLTGGADAEPPTPTLTAAADTTDPFTALSLVSSEPLPTGVNPVLRSGGGEAIELPPYTTGTMGSFVARFDKPTRMLRYGEQYDVSVDGMRDFAGNTAVGSSNLSFKTGPAPPLAAEDGFESLADVTFGGAQVLSGAGAPTITGAKSLYIPNLTSPASAQAPQLALRLQLAAGDTVVRFSYRTINPTFAYGIVYTLGSEGGTIATPTLPPDTGGTTMATLGGSQVSLGPVTTATFALPADATNEIVLERTVPVPRAGCGLPPRPIAGIIIDDLRAE